MTGDFTEIRVNNIPEKAVMYLKTPQYLVWAWQGKVSTDPTFYIQQQA